jgi:hypothetical protein
MCMDHKMMCQCKKNSAGFDFKDNVMPVEVIKNLYCPGCSPAVAFSEETMLGDNGWVIEYDMEVANLMAGRLPGHAAVTPEFLFDKGYCTWRGIYPTDLTDSLKEREGLKELSRVNPKEYFSEFRKWAVGRMERLAAEGWRKANV